MDVNDHDHNKVHNKVDSPFYIFISKGRVLLQ